MKALIPRCAGCTVGSVFASSRKVLPCRALVIHNFEPLIRYTSPSRVAVVLRFCRSVPAFDSVRQIPPRFSPDAIPGKNRRFCSSLAKRATTSHITECVPSTPANPSQPREISSKIMAKVVVFTSAPPYSSGTFSPNSPISFIWRTRSCGYSLRCSISEATGITSLSTNFRTVLRINSCSSVKAPAIKNILSQRAPRSPPGPVVFRPPPDIVGSYAYQKPCRSRRHFHRPAGGTARLAQRLGRRHWTCSPERERYRCPAALLDPTRRHAHQQRETSNDAVSRDLRHSAQTGFDRRHRG